MGGAAEWMGTPGGANGSADWHFWWSHPAGDYSGKPMKGRAAKEGKGREKVSHNMKTAVSDERNSCFSFFGPNSKLHKIIGPLK